MGDVYMDGNVDVQDAYLVQVYFADSAADNDPVFYEGEELNARIIAEVADIDLDGLITINDAYLIMRYFADHAAEKDVTWEQERASRVDSYNSTT